MTVLSLLETAQNIKLRFNLDKIQLNTRECKFFLQLLTPDGIGVDPRKVAAIRQMDAPQCKRVLKSFQGMVGYLQHYSSQCTQLVESLK